MLTHLGLRGCVNLKNVDGLEGLPALTDLDLFNSESLENVNGLKGLRSLRSLDLSSCKNLQNVDGLKGLTTLSKLCLSACVNLKSVDGLQVFVFQQPAILFFLRFENALQRFLRAGGAGGLNLFLEARLQGRVVNFDGHGQSLIISRLTGTAKFYEISSGTVVSRS
jgi:hypothetical protein